MKDVFNGMTLDDMMQKKTRRVHWAEDDELVEVFYVDRLPSECFGRARDVNRPNIGKPIRIKLSDARPNIGKPRRIAIDCTEMCRQC